MSDRFNPPEDIQFHERIYTGLTHGDIQRVATLAGKHRSQLSRELNPEEPARSAPYQTCVELEAWRVTNYEVFDLLADVLTDFIVSRRVMANGEASADAQSLAAYCQQFVGLMLKVAGEEELKAVARVLHTVSGAYLKPNLEEVRRQSLVSVPSEPGGAASSRESRGRASNG